MIYFVTVNYYSSGFIADLISSIRRGDFDKQSGGQTDNADTPALKIIVINNSPDNESLYDLIDDNILILEAGTNLGFGKACNLGLNWIYTQDSQAIVWIINPDTQLLPGALEKVPAFFTANPQLSIVGTIVYTPTDEVWFAGGEFIEKNGAIICKTTLNDRTTLAYLETDWVSGCSLLLNLQKFATCPQFDPDYFLYYEDFDFCRRYAKEGHLIAIAPQIAVVHQPSSITGKNILTKFKHSTYSYLLTVGRYSKKTILILRLTRLVFHAIILMPVKPQIGFGKLHGVWLYLRRVFT